MCRCWCPPGHTAHTEEARQFNRARARYRYRSREVG